MTYANSKVLIASISNNKVQSKTAVERCVQRVGAAPRPNMGFRLGEKHRFRMRCRAVLLNSDGLSASEAGAQTGMGLVSVNAWVKRYREEGIDGLNTRMGRGHSACTLRLQSDGSPDCRSDAA